VGPAGAGQLGGGVRREHGFLDPYEQTPLQSTSYLLWTGPDLQVGANGKTVHPAAHPMNETTSQ
jgi:hypothetical protein